MRKLGELIRQELIEKHEISLKLFGTAFSLGRRGIGQARFTNAIKIGQKLLHGLVCTDITITRRRIGNTSVCANLDTSRRHFGGGGSPNGDRQTRILERNPRKR